MSAHRQQLKTASIVPSIPISELPACKQGCCSPGLNASCRTGAEAKAKTRWLAFVKLNMHEQQGQQAGVQQAKMRRTTALASPL
jgi:hypothetical protein